MPWRKMMAVLIGFPIISTVISLLVLNRSMITDLGLDFNNAFFAIVTIWYLIQIYILYRILKSEGWTWKDIGYHFNARKTIYFSMGYLAFAFGLLFFIEYTLSHATFDQEKLESVMKLSPRTTLSRVIFIFMGLAAGLAEEFVYRGFAIRGLVSNGLNKWAAVLLAAIPFLFQHGVKAYQVTWGTWYIVWGIILGLMFLFLKKLHVNIIIHWLVILSALLAVLQAVK